MADSRLFISLPAELVPRPMIYEIVNDVRHLECNEPIYRFLANVSAEELDNGDGNRAQTVKQRLQISVNGGYGGPRERGRRV